jgi:hypothetical protein
VQLELATVVLDSYTAEAEFAQEGGYADRFQSFGVGARSFFYRKPHCVPKKRDGYETLRVG